VDRVLVTIQLRLRKLGHRAIVQKEIALAPRDDFAEIVVTALAASRIEIAIYLRSR
jgi:hypothetical protein